MLPMPLIRPRRLSPGQTIGLVAPSSAPNDPEQIRFAIETMESLGFRVRPGAHLFDRDGYLAGADALRAADLNAMFADDRIDAIWCVRGGYGASRILPLLDYEQMRRAPKALVGYSDITALHMALHTRADLVAFTARSPGGRSRRIRSGSSSACSSSLRCRFASAARRPSSVRRDRWSARTGSRRWCRASPGADCSEETSV